MPENKLSFLDFCMKYGYSGNDRESAQEYKNYQFAEASRQLPPDFFGKKVDISENEITDINKYLEEKDNDGQPEHDKNRWILVTERYPNEHDGKPEYESGERYTRVIAHVVECYGKKWDRVMEIRFFEGTDFSQFCYKFDKWQPLPEA